MKLWNVFYDGLLRMRLLDGVSVIGFAVALIVVNHTSKGLYMTMNISLIIIEK